MIDKIARARKALPRKDLADLYRLTRSVVGQSEDFTDKAFYLTLLALHQESRISSREAQQEIIAAGYVQCLDTKEWYRLTPCERPA
ncbi:hypothetical protein [Agrobacterium tumefaciens]|uniref:hypothetical protein n=1 Tax=Agrobacterium tumefaciens TaxID=358 RepID=UPI001573C2FA|nr:hypothetical protein [Agrobacterium tumefaciens]